MALNEVYSPVLYISYDGILEPLGQSQVLSYLEQLSAIFPIFLISFEKESDLTMDDHYRIVLERVRAAGIHWYPLRYHKRFSVMATSWDILIGFALGVYISFRHRVQIVHARSYVAAVMALGVKRLTGCRFLFDMRGFWADERVDGGLWERDGHLHRCAKWFERRFLLEADHIVSLTQAAVRLVKDFPYLRGKKLEMTVIPTCTNLARFSPGSARPAGLTLGYVGSAGLWYEFDAAAYVFGAVLQRRMDARILIVNRGEHEYIVSRLALARVPLERVEIVSAIPAEVPHLMKRMHAGVFFIKPVYSKQASAPTKLGEFLGCALPCLSNRGVGDMAAVLEGDRVGVAVDGFSAAALESGVDRLLELLDEPGLGARCVAAAHRHFSLEEGVRRYAAIYRSLCVVN